MRKETTAALFAVLLLLSTSVATVSAFEWGWKEQPLPPEVVPYKVYIESVYLENWWGEAGVYRGLDAIVFTADIVAITNMYQSEFEQTISSLAGNDFAMYSTKIVIEQYIVVTPDILTPEIAEALHEYLGDPTTLWHLEIDMLALSASNVAISGFASVTYPNAITVTSKSVVMADWDIVGTTYPETSTKVTKITGDLTINENTEKVVDGDYTYTLTAPKTVMENAVIYATSVKGRALGLVPLSWSGSNVPWLVRLAKLFFGKIFMTCVTMKVVSISADSVTMNVMTQTILA